MKRKKIGVLIGSVTNNFSSRICRTISEKAEEYGMTMRAIANEMVRVGKDAIMMLDLLDETQNAEQETE